MNGKHLVGGHFCLDYPSVGATETLMMAAALADGKSTLSNVAQVHKLLTKQYIPTHPPTPFSCSSQSLLAWEHLRLENANTCQWCQEPEVKDLADFLISCGAIIHGAGTNTLNITGRRKLHGTDYQIIPDRIEAGTFLIAAAITHSTINIAPVVPSHLTSVTSKLCAIGCHIQQTSSNGLKVG
jgi:UDP-N-acetylglucosamine 1-carboxyvinyltransferase